MRRERRGVGRGAETEGVHVGGEATRRPSEHRRSRGGGGGGRGEAMRWGVARGLFSNESGLGSAPMAIAAARVQRPIHGGLVSMLGPFLDTLIICTITGLVILLSGGLEQRSEELVGAALTAHAFQLEFGAAGAWVVGIGLTLFAFSTMIGWSYYGDRCAFFLFGQRAVLPYRIFYTVIAGCGTMVALPLVWNLSDIANLAMALPNLLSLLLLSGLAARLYKDHRTGADDGGA